MERAREMKAAFSERRKKEERPVGRSSRAAAGKPHRDKDLGYWLLPLPTIDPQVVQRSGAALASYGPKFTYSPYARSEEHTSELKSLMRISYAVFCLTKKTTQT